MGLGSAETAPQCLDQGHFSLQFLIFQSQAGVFLLEYRHFSGQQGAVIDQTLIESGRCSPFIGLYGGG